MKAAGRIRIPERFLLVLRGGDRKYDTQNEQDIASFVNWMQTVQSDEFRAWQTWGSVVGSIWLSRQNARPGAEFKQGMDLVRREARYMRSALCSQDWQRARLHGLEAENALLRMKLHFLVPVAAQHPKKGSLLQRFIFQRALRVENSRVWRRHGREMTHRDAMRWAELRGLLPQNLSDRAAMEWIADVLGRPRRGRPTTKNVRVRTRR